MGSNNFDGHPVIKHFLQYGCFAFVMDLVTIGLRLSCRFKLLIDDWWCIYFPISVSDSLVRMTWNGMRCALGVFLTLVDVHEVVYKLCSVVKSTLAGA